MYIGNVVTAPALKFVMMKSSKLSENDRSAAARMPGSSSGKTYTLKKGANGSFTSTAPPSTTPATTTKK